MKPRNHLSFKGEESDRVAERRWEAEGGKLEDLAGGKEVPPGSEAAGITLKVDIDKAERPTS